MFKVAWWSCVATEGENPSIYAAQREGAKVFISQGDEPYMQNNATAYGVTRSVLDKDSTVANFVTAYEQTHDAPSIQSLVNGPYDFYKMPDDHEWGGDNWDHTITQANSQTGISAVTQADADQHGTRAIAAFQQIAATYTDNPTNNDAEAIAEKPSEAGGTVDASDYPPLYFRVGYDINGTVDNTTPHVEFFFIDCISHRSPLADTDDASKTMLGANQKNWLKTYLNSGTATFKVIVSGKKTYIGTSGDNSDTWDKYTTERDELLAYIDTNSITGVLWIAGDKHYANVMTTEKPGDTYDHFCICACPSGKGTNGIVSGNEITWNHDGNVFGLLEINETYIETKVLRYADARVLFKARLNAGENKRTFPALEVAI